METSQTINNTIYSKEKVLIIKRVKIINGVFNKRFFNVNIYLKKQKYTMFTITI